MPISTAVTKQDTFLTDSNSPETLPSYSDTPTQTPPEHPTDTPPQNSTRPVATPETVDNNKCTPNDNTSDSVGLFSSKTTSTTTHGAPLTLLLDYPPPSPVGKQQPPLLPSSLCSSSTLYRDMESEGEKRGQRRDLIVELETESSEGSTTSGRLRSEREPSGGASVETGGEWATAAVSGRETGSTKTSGAPDSVTVLDVEEEEEEEEEEGRRDTKLPATKETGPPYLFEKLSDVPAVRDQSEVEAAERALERLAGKQPHQLTPSDRIWELAACGGSTQAKDDVTLDSDSKERIKERLRAKKLTDKTTLAF